MTGHTPRLLPSVEVLAPTPVEARGGWSRFAGRLLQRTPQERHALRVSFLCHFLVLASYYVIRPIRDEAGVAGGVGKLPWMFTATLAGTRRRSCGGARARGW